MDEKIGGWAFIIGILLAIIGGLISGLNFAEPGWIIIALVIIGLIVGFLNVSDKEITPFLIAAIALMSMGGGASGTIKDSLDKVLPGLGSVLISVTTHIVAFVAPAALIVALIEVYKITSTSEGLKLQKGK